PVSQQQTTLAFDMPLDDHDQGQIQEEEQSKVVTFDMGEDVDQYDVKDAVEVVPVTEVSEDGTKRYSLDDYMEIEDRLNSAKPSAKKQEPVVEKELQFEKKVVEQQPTEGPDSGEIDPMNSSIEDSLRNRADERRRKLKDFNYKFNKNSHWVEEIEKQPAYKRMGIDLDAKRSDDQSSRMSIGSDSNDEIQLR